MDLIRPVKTVTEADAFERMPGVPDINSVFVDFLNKRAVRSDVVKVRAQLLAVARRLRSETVKLNKITGDANVQQKLEALFAANKVKGHWASHLLSIPLLDSAIHQLANAKSVHDAMLAMARLIGIVEDQEDPVDAPFKPRMRYENARYNNLYKMLAQAAGWPKPDVDHMNEVFGMFNDQIVARLAEKIRNGARLNQQPRPKGW